MASLSDLENLKKTVAKEEYYQDLIIFFEREIKRLGVDETLQKYLLGDNEFARDIYPRLYHGYVHSIMHVGLGLEFDQPSILAEGLAEAVVSLISPIYFPIASELSSSVSNFLSISC